MVQTLSHVVDGFVFRWQASVAGYDSHIQVYTKRHFDNCLANGTSPWAMEEIKVRASNGDFAFGPEVFIQFCEDWLANPVMWNRLVRNEIQRIENRASDAENKNLPYRIGDHGDTPNLPYPVKEETVPLSDFPYIGYKPRNLDV